MFNLPAFLATLPEAFKYTKAALVGTTFILGKGNDIDIICLVSDLEEGVTQLDESWVLSDDEHYDDLGRFCSLRQGEYNLLLVADSLYFDNWIKAAEVCKYLEIADRTKRVDVHCLIMDGRAASNFMQEDSPPDCFLDFPEPPALST